MWYKVKCHSFRHNIINYHTYGLTSAITNYGKWVSNIARHTFPIHHFGYNNIGKPFPQTRISLDRDQVKICLLNKIKFCSGENQLKTYEVLFCC